MKRQEQLNEAWCKYMGKCSTEIMQALAFALRWADQHPHWISVEEELPLCGRQVLVCNEHAKSYGIWRSWRDSEGGDFFNLDINGFLTLCDDGNEPIQVTHWMPLPQPPKKWYEE